MTRLVCDKGHAWELPAAGGGQTQTWPAPCPVCGRPGEQDSQPHLPLPPGYTFLGTLGRGGMGIVYQARQDRLERIVAIKFLPPEAARDAAFAERFAREARSLARLSHPHIVTIFDYGQEAGHPYFVMEHVEGVSLRTLLDRRDLNADDCLRLAGEMCEALQYAHEEGIVHRDIKPENILLDKRGRVKIADFGLAKLLTGPAFALTGPDHVLGTLRYMAPEQFADPSNLDHRADIYSFGVILYEMLTGQLPQGRFPAPSEVSRVDARWDEIVHRALAKDPARRYSSVRDIRLALGRIAQQRLEEHVKLPWRGAQPLPPPLPDSAWNSGDSSWDRAAPGVSIRAAEPPADSWSVRGRLAAPAGTLLASAILGFALNVFLTAIFFGEENTRGWLTLLILNGLALITCCFTIGSAVAVLRLRSYRLALAGCCAGMLPIAFSCGLTVAPSVWTFIMLLKPDVRAAFGTSEPVDSSTPTTQPRREKSGSLLSAVYCLIGFLLCILPLPWIIVTVDEEAVSRVTALEIWPGILALILFLALALALVAASYSGVSSSSLLLGVTGLAIAGSVGFALVSARLPYYGAAGFREEGGRKIRLGEARVQELRLEVAGVQRHLGKVAEPGSRVVDAEGKLRVVGAEFWIFRGEPPGTRVAAGDDGSLSNRLRASATFAPYAVVALGLGLFFLGLMQRKQAGPAS